MDFSLKLQRITVRFQEFTSKSLFSSIWRWKIDPWLTDKPFDSPVITVTKNNTYDYNPSALHCLSKKKAGFFEDVVARSPNGDTVWNCVRVSTGKSYLVFVVKEPKDRVILALDNTGTSGAAAFEYLGHILPYVGLLHGEISLHGVLMEYDSRGIIISASSGIGKTTHARLWRDHKRALILNGDRATCCIDNGHWIGYSLPWSGTSGECINRDVPLTAFVALEQSAENRVERLYGLDAFNAVMPNLIYPSWDKELMEKALDYIDSFLEKIPVFRLSCRPDLEAVETLEKALREL